MLAILKRELRAYFLTPLGYVYLAIVFLFTGFFFFTYNLFGTTTDTSSMYGQLFTLALFVSPVLTMRLLPEDRRLHIDRQLMAAPISQGAVAIGKYLTAVIVYAMSISCSLLMIFVMSIYGKPDWPVVLGNYIGLLLLGCALISICLFLSAFTESQFIAVICGFASGMALMLLDAISLRMGSGFTQDILLSISFNNRYIPFTLGIFDIGGAIFFLSISLLFVTLTTLVLERRMWS